MINLHCHTYFSDGVLGPAELLTRCVKLGYKAVALTDHADESNFEFIISNIKKVTVEFNKAGYLKALCGVELTYVLPKNIDKVAIECKKLGAEIVVVHGETIVEPVLAETNIYATQSKFVDILAHPGFISERALKFAVKNDVMIEITSRKGHSLTNGYVAAAAQKAGAKIILSTDAHTPEDLITGEFGEKVLRGAGLDKKAISTVWNNAEKIAGIK